MTPIGELRLSIPMGIIVHHLNTVSVFFVSVIGNLVPAIFLLFFLKKVSVYFSEKSRIFHKLFTWWQTNAKKRYSEKVSRQGGIPSEAGQKYETIGLALFIAVPLPMTGAWTGALLAILMNLPFKKSFLAILLGVIGAGLIVTTMVVLGINIEKYFGWQILLGLLIICASAFLLRKFLVFKK